MTPEPRPDIDFFPLTIDFEERLYAVGKIPGSFPRREGRPSTDAVLAGRMTDRALRPGPNRNHGGQCTGTGGLPRLDHVTRKRGW